jgi:hypothetical protein
VQENGQADGRPGNRGFDPVHDAAIVMIDAPRTPAHAATPFSYANVMPVPDFSHNCRQIRGRRGTFRSDWASGGLIHREAFIGMRMN